MAPKLLGVAPSRLESVSWRKPGLVEITVSTYALSENFVMPAEPDIAEYVGFGDTVPILQAIRAQNEGVATKVSWIFRAGRELPDSETDRQETDKKSQWSMDVSLMQVPITVHPNLKVIMEVGGGVFRDGEVDFPRMFNKVRNPYYGTSDFLVPSVTMSCQTIEPSSGLLFGQIDKLGYSRKGGKIQKPEGRGGDDIGFTFVNINKGSERLPWLLVEHNVRRVGNEQFESKTWRYGGVLGWANAIYDHDFSFAKAPSSGAPGGSPLGAV